VVNKLHPHVLRASCATIAAAAGVPQHEIQLLLGHADPRTTAVYINSRELHQPGEKTAGQQITAGSG